MDLELWVKTGVTHSYCYYTNSNSVNRLFSYTFKIILRKVTNIKLIATQGDYYTKM